MLDVTGKLSPVMIAILRSGFSPAIRLAWLAGEPTKGQPKQEFPIISIELCNGVVEVSVQVIPELAAWSRQAFSLGLQK